MAAFAIAGHLNGGDTGFFQRYPKNRILAGGIVVPLWIDGLTFNVEYTDARTAPQEKFGLQNTDVFDQLALRLRYAWLRGRSANFNIEGSFDTQNETLHQHLILSLTGRAQTSFNQPLLNSERIGIANTSALSAFDSGTLVGDQGYVVRGELQSPWSLPQTGVSNATGRNIGVVISPYLFAAYGEVLIEDPTILEVASIRAASYGVGVRFGGAAAGTLSNGSLGLEYGYATRSDNMPSDHRFTIVSSVRF